MFRSWFLSYSSSARPRSRHPAPPSRGMALEGAAGMVKTGRRVPGTEEAVETVPPGRRGPGPEDGGGNGAAATPQALASPVVAVAPQTWHVLVNNVSPAGENWSFNAFYPDHLQAHPGDTIIFTLAPNPNAFHTVMVLVKGITPLEMYQGFAGGFVQPNPNQTDQLQSAFFGNEPNPPCGRAGQDPCLLANPTTIEFGISSAVAHQPAVGRRPTATPPS